MNPTRKPEQVVIWGTGNLTHQFIPLLNESNIKIAAIVDSYNSGTIFDNHSVLSPQQYLSTVSCKVPIVPTGRSKIENKSRFHDICMSIFNGFRFENIKILHPAFLSDFISLDYRAKPSIIGFPGSGNQLLHTILNELYVNQIHHNSLENLFSSLAREHQTDIQIILDKNLNRFLSNPVSNIFSDSINNNSYEAHGIDGSMLISGIKGWPYLFKNHQSHENISQHVIDKLTRINSRIFFALRNPLDVIISNAFKVNEFFDSGFNKANPEICNTLCDSNSKLREDLGILHLNNFEWFEKIATDLKTYMEDYLNLNKYLTTIKYENLLNNPRQTICLMMEKLDMDIKPDKADIIWEKAGLKPISGPGHFFRPGINKSLKYLNRNHHLILSSLGYDELLSNLGYTIDWNITDAQKEIPDKNPQLLSCLCQIRDTYKLSVQTKSGSGIFSISGTSKVLAKHFLDCLLSETNYFEQILDSALI